MSKNSYEKPDFWAIKAKKDGYPARSVYKLEEMDKKFRLFKQGISVLDIGAAPGSWSLWVLKRLAGKGFLAAVDLQDLRISPKDSNFFFVKGDLYDQAVKKELLAKGPYDLIVSDAAPATSGNSGVDSDRSEAIVEAVLDYADTMLKPGGSVIAKLFMGAGQKALLDRIKASYALGRAFKPQTCRSESFETYLLGIGKIKPGPGL